MHKLLSIIFISIALMLTACGRINTAEITSELEPPTHKQVLETILEPLKGKPFSVLANEYLAGQDFTVTEYRGEEYVTYTWKDLSLIIRLDDEEKIKSFYIKELL